jgi:hypothetical protein
MSMKIFSQRELSFAHLEAVLKILPDAIAEIGGGKCNPMMVAQGISSVASGSDQRFFATLVIDGAVAGFAAGHMELDVFLAQRVAREVFAYLRPPARNSANRAALLEAFEAWATAQNAERIECLADANDAGDSFAAVAGTRGYKRAQMVLRKAR